MILRQYFPPPNLFFSEIFSSSCLCVVSLLSLCFSSLSSFRRQMRHGRSLLWTVALLVHSSGAPTGIFVWDAQPPAIETCNSSDHIALDPDAKDQSGVQHARPVSVSSSFNGSYAVVMNGVLPYTSPGCGVLFPSMAWHRSVVPAESRWPFEVHRITCAHNFLSYWLLTIQGTQNESFLRKTHWEGTSLPQTETRYQNNRYIYFKNL